MPLKLVRTPDDPRNMVRAVYVPDRPNPRRPSGLRDRRPIHRGAEYLLGLDLGQANDYTALVAVQRVAHGYAVPLITRTRNRPYPALVERVTDLLAAPPFTGRSQLILDATGVGRPVLDLFRAADLAPVAVTITGGNRVTGTVRALQVPKRDLITALLVAFQNRRIKIAAGAEHAETLLAELSAVRLRFTAAGHDQYGSWRDGEHDDLVLALALAIWWGERHRPSPALEAPRPAEPEPSSRSRRGMTNWDLLDELDDLSERRPVRP